MIRDAGETQPQIGNNHQKHECVYVDDIVIDFSTRTATRESKPVPLTATEFTIVKMLIDHRGVIVPRSTLYDAIYEEEDKSLANRLDVHISNIRKKIGFGFLQTRRGHGYIIDK